MKNDLIVSLLAVGVIAAIMYGLGYRLPPLPELH
jgi:hypothetical protein